MFKNKTNLNQLKKAMICKYITIILYFIMLALLLAEVYVICVLVLIMSIFFGILSIIYDVDFMFNITKKELR